MNTDHSIQSLGLYELLHHFSQQRSPKSYLEIGVNECKSTLQVIKGYPPDVLFLCDTWGGDYGGTGKGSHDYASKIISTSFKGKVVWLDGDSKKLVPFLGSETIEMALVDGDHSADGCRTDMENTLRVLKPNGLMIVDDLTHPEHPYLQSVFNEFCNINPVNVLKQFGVGVIQKQP